MMRRPRLLFAMASVAAALVGSDVSRAQTTATTPTIGPSGNQFPHRFVGTSFVPSNDLGTGRRPVNLTPLGISYQDCLDDQSLHFDVNVSGFQGQSIELWASLNGDCSVDANRGNGGVAVCWPLGVGMTGVNQPSASPLPFNVRVRDIVGPQLASPAPTTYSPRGVEACSSQATFSSETFNVYFVPIANGSRATGTAYNYQLPVDLVGPPAPGGVHEQVGDTLFTVTWAPNADTDTGGYDVFIDPLPGQEDAGTTFAPPEPLLVCDEAGPIASGDDSSTAGGPSDATTDSSLTNDSASSAPASSDAGASNATEASCHLEIFGGPPAPGGSCSDSLLTAAVVQDGGGTVVVTSDSGTDGGTITISGNGGISTVPRSHLVGASGSGATVSDKSTGTYTIRGLRNGTSSSDDYNVVVSAVDLFGNVGPPSAEVCDFPAPVDDFWKVYRKDGGQAGGGFCAVEAVGARTSPLAALAVGAGALALARRRRRSAR